jgi:hypothetical protein
VLKSGDGFVVRSLAFSGERLAPLQPQMGWGTRSSPFLPRSLNQALNPFNTAHLGHGTLGPHALGRERDRDHY